MECLWSKVIKFCKVIWSYFVALVRLVVWTFVFFFSGLQRTLFMKSEITGVDFKVLPLRCYMEETDDKLSYLDKLCMENPELVDIIDEEDIPFGEEDIDFKPHDNDNGEEDL